MRERKKEKKEEGHPPPRPRLNFLVQLFLTTYLTVDDSSGSHPSVGTYSYTFFAYYHPLYPVFAPPPQVMRRI